MTVDYCEMPESFSSNISKISIHILSLIVFLFCRVLSSTDAYKRKFLAFTQERGRVLENSVSLGALQFSFFFYMYILTVLAYITGHTKCEVYFFHTE